jgi:hypothetical protein
MTREEAKEILGAYHPLTARRAERRAVPWPCVPSSPDLSVHGVDLCGACGAPLLGNLPTRCLCCGVPNVSQRAYHNLEMDRVWREIRDIAKAFKGEIIFKPSARLGHRWSDI